jgi:hypothetical protein
MFRCKIKVFESMVLVGIATGYRLDDRDSIPGGGKRFFFAP